MEMKTLGVLLVLFVGLLIGISLLTTTADEVTKTQQTKTATNETHLFSSPDNSTTLTHTDVISISYIANSTRPNANYTITSLSLGTLWMNTSGSQNVTYLYYPTEYVKDSTSRTLINLVILFFALGIVGIAIAGLYQTGLFDLFKKQ